MQRQMPFAEFDHALREAVEIAVLFEERPIEPTGRVVPAVGVVVAVLRFAGPRRRQRTWERHVRAAESSPRA